MDQISRDGFLTMTRNMLCSGWMDEHEGQLHTHVMLWLWLHCTNDDSNRLRYPVPIPSYHYLYLFLPSRVSGMGNQVLSRPNNISVANMFNIPPHLMILSSKSVSWP